MEPVFGKIDTFETLSLICWESPPPILFAMMIHPRPAASTGKMFIYLWQKWHWVTSYRQSVIIFCLWSREWSDNRENVPTVLCCTYNVYRLGDGCKIDSTYGYLAKACRAFFGKTSQLILFYDLKVWGWMAERVGRGRPTLKWKFQRTSKFPGGLCPDSAEGERGEGEGGRGAVGI